MSLACKHMSIPSHSKLISTQMGSSKIEPEPYISDEPSTPNQQGANDPVLPRF